MNKSILVIDTPKMCGECPLFEFAFTDCVVDGQEVTEEIQNRTRRKDCKLKPLPQKKDEHVKLDYSAWELESIINAENRGYNRCLEELLGEENETK